MHCIRIKKEGGLDVVSGFGRVYIDHEGSRRKQKEVLAADKDFQRLLSQRRTRINRALRQARGVAKSKKHFDEYLSAETAKIGAEYKPQLDAIAKKHEPEYIQYHRPADGDIQSPAQHASDAVARRPGHDLDLDERALGTGRQAKRVEWSVSHDRLMIAAERLSGNAGRPPGAIRASPATRRGGSAGQAPGRCGRRAAKSLPGRPVPR